MVGTVASEQEGPGFESANLESIYADVSSWALSVRSSSSQRNVILICEYECV